MRARLHGIEGEVLRGIGRTWTSLQLTRFKGTCITGFLSVPELLSVSPSFWYWLVVWVQSVSLSHFPGRVSQLDTEHNHTLLRSPHLDARYHRNVALPPTKLLPSPSRRLRWCMQTFPRLHWTNSKPPESLPSPLSTHRSGFLNKAKWRRKEVCWGSCDGYLSSLYFLGILFDLWDIWRGLVEPGDLSFVQGCIFNYNFIYQWILKVTNMSFSYPFWAKRKTSPAYCEKSLRPSSAS